MFTVNGKVEEFGINERKRRYLVVTVDFNTAKQIFSADRYRAETGVGEQRELVTSHVKTLRKEIEDGNFTPTSISIGLRSQQEGVTLVEENGFATLTLADGATLPLLDGGHRHSALEFLFEQEAYKEEIGKSSVTALVLLDGNTKKDFLNLQKGRPVDKSHIHSLSVQEKLLKQQDAEMLTIAYDAAKLLNSDAQSPFHKQIRFDSVGVSGIPISSLSSKGASDIATSLVGGAKIAIEFKKDAAWLAKQIVTAYIYLKDGGAKELLERGMMLTPPPEGTKGSATMLIGVGNMLAARVALKGNTSAESIDVQTLVKTAKETLGRPVNGNFSGPTKRTVMGAFAEAFFADIVTKEDSHFGVPKKLIKLLSVSTFASPKMEKEVVQKEPKPVVVKVKKEKAKKAETAPVAEPEKDDSGLFDPEVVPAKPEVDTTFEITETAPWEDEAQG